MSPRAFRADILAVPRRAGRTVAAHFHGAARGAASPSSQDFRKVHGAPRDASARGRRPRAFARTATQISRNNPMAKGIAQATAVSGTQRGGNRKIPRNTPCKAIPRNNPMQSTSLEPRASLEIAAARRLAQNSEEQPHAKQLAHAVEPALRSPHQRRRRVSIARDAERPMPDARRIVSRRTQGQQERVQARTLQCGGDRQATRDRSAVAAHASRDGHGQARRPRMLILRGPRRGIVAIGQHCCRKASSGV